MTREEFSTTAFSINRKAHYDTHTVTIVAVDFEEGLLSLRHPEDIVAPYNQWVRCENIELLPHSVNSTL